MTYEIRESIAVDAPREAVWRILHDPSRRSQWDVRVISSQYLSSALESGTQARMMLRVFGLLMPVTVEYLAVAPPTRSIVRSIRPCELLGEFEAEWILESQPDGSTLWTTLIRISSTIPLLAWIVGKVLQRPTRISQGNLKRLVEAEPRPRAVRFPRGTFATVRI